MLKFKLFTLFCCYVCGVLSLTSFIKQGQRAEIFELTDNEMAVVKISLPQNEFPLFMENANLNEKYINIETFLNNCFIILKELLKQLKNLNFPYYFPNKDYEIIIPELKIGEDGYPIFDIEEVLNGFDFDPEHYSERYNDDQMLMLLIKIYSSNENFKFYEIIEKMDKLQLNKELEDEGITMDNIFYIDNTLFENIYSFDFKTKNATMIVDLNLKQKKFSKVTFSLGGKYSRYFSKPGYNIKIRGDKDLYGRKQFKLRSDCNEPTFLRTKLVSDIHNRLGIPSVSSNYIKLYINEEYMGLYLLNDAYKPSWIKYVYGENDTKTLYKCNGIFELKKDYSTGCVNEDKDVNDDTEWIEFLDAVENANSASDLEDIFEIDHFLTEIALEYLLGAWDHIQNSHNFYMYKQPNGKWIYLSQDFDHDFGFRIKDNLSFSEFANDFHIIDILILKDPRRFENILKDIVMNVFNPSTLYPRIDELKNYIKPMVEMDKTPNNEGKYPGRINSVIDDLYSMEMWDANSEFITVKTQTYAYELKYWILSQYRYVCKEYSLDCEQKYLDENFQYPVNKDIEYDPSLFYHSLFDDLPLMTDMTDFPMYSTTFVDDISSTVNYEEVFTTITKTKTTFFTSTEIPTITEISSEMTTPVSTSEIDIPSITTTNEIDIPTITVTSKVDIPTITSTTTTTTTNTVISITSTSTITTSISSSSSSSSTPTNEKINQYQCWAELLGYSCCAEGITKVYAQDTYGDWSYDFEKQEWCGLTTYEKHPSDSDECWSEEFGYACCKGCYIIETDDIGSWGYESNHWCGIPTRCQK